MKNPTILILFLGLTIFVSCNDHPKKTLIVNDFDMASFIKDSTTILSDITDTVIDGNLEGSKMNAHFYTIPEKEFVLAINRNKNHIRYFNRHIKLNEYNENGVIYRNDSVLKIKGKYNNAHFVDVKEDKNHRATKFFIEGRVGAYYLVKRIQFEDAETVFWNSETGKDDLHLRGLSVCVNPKDSLIFYSNTSRVVPEEKNSICLMKVHPYEVDTLLCVNTDWATNFSFFDNEDSSIYYVHTFYDANKLESAYAKIDLKLK